MIHVIRASIGNYDYLRPHHVEFTEALFCDVTETEHFHRDKRRTAKQFKVIPHRMFPDEVQDGDLVLWLDASHALEVSPEEVLEDWLPENIDFAHMRHNTQDCLYEEIKTCLYHGLDTMENLLWIWNLVQHEGFPARAGLGTNTVLAMRISPRVRSLLEYWWDLIERGSVRDQCSFEYALWKHPEVKRRLISGNVYDHPYFSFVRHQGPIPEQKLLTR